MISWFDLLRGGARAVIGSALLLGTLDGGLALAQPAPNGSITLDDLLHAQSLGEAWLSPGGRRVLYSRGRAIADTARRTFDSDLNGQAVFISLRGAAGRALVEEGGVTYAPISGGTPWAPDSSGALVFAVANGASRLAWWDAATGKVKALPGLPASSFAVFDWLDDRLVYATLAPGEIQRDSRVQMLDELNARWRRAWTGREPQVTVSSANPAFAADGRPPGRLLLGNPATGEARQIAEGDFTMVRAAPGGTRFATLRMAESARGALSLTGQRMELQLFAVNANGAVTVHGFPDLDVGYGALAWSADGRRLLVGAQARGGDGVAGLYMIDAKSGRATPVATGGLRLDSPGVVSDGMLTQIGWIGDRPAAIAGARAEAPVSNAATAGRSYSYGEAANLRFDLYLFESAGPRNLTAFAQTPVTNFITPGGQRAAYVTADGALWSVVAGTAPRRLTAPQLGNVVAFGVDPHYPQPAPSTAYYRADGVERIDLMVLNQASAPVRLVWDLKNQRVVTGSIRKRVYATSADLTTTVSRVTDRWADGFVFNDGSGEKPLGTVNMALNDRVMAVPTSFIYKVGEQELTGWVLKPVGAPTDRPLPAVVWIYGGEIQGPQPPPDAMTQPIGPLFSGQLMAAQGYAVIYPSTPLPQGSSGDLPGVLAQETIAAVDELARKGVVDPARVGLIGHSFGGYSVAAVLAVRSDRFKAGVSLSGIYDLQWGWGAKALGATLADDGSDEGFTLGWKRVEVGQAQLGQPFWKDNAPYIRNSPIQKVETLNSPLLMLHGDLDTGNDTALGGAERMYAALLRAGKQPTLVHYWGEGHLPNSEWAIRDQWSRVLKWFDLYVRGR